MTGGTSAHRAGIVAAACTVALAATGLAASHQVRAAGAACATTDPGGGSWPAYGHDLSGTRTQDQETALGAGNVAGVTRKWSFTSSNGGFESTPAVADGCVFTGTAGGEVLALNADTGAVVWTNQVVAATTSAGYGGLIVGAPAVDSANGLVIVAVDRYTAPFVVALHESDGSIAWQSQPIDSAADGDWGNVAGQNASPTVWNGMVVLGFYGSEFDPRARGGFVILDETSGARLAHTYTISDADYALGYRGASIWATAAIDPATGYAYVGTGNPGGSPAPGTNPDQFPECTGTLPGQPCRAAIEDPMADAIIKIDLDRTRATFGHIVGAAKGNPDNYIEGAGNQPACANLGDVVEVGTSPPAGAWSAACGQLDLDFGASPNLFATPTGAVVGELQKSGVYHVAYTASMEKAWDGTVGGPCQACNAGSTAVDGAGVYGVSAPGGTAFSLSAVGTARWATPLGDGLHYQSTSAANGVVYTVDTTGFLDALDAGTGLPLLRRSLASDSGQSESDLGSSGVAIARHTVYVAESGFLVAYGL